jgi:hypothetical protein
MRTLNFSGALHHKPNALLVSVSPPPRTRHLPRTQTFRPGCALPLGRWSDLRSYDGRRMSFGSGLYLDDKTGAHGAINGCIG